MDDNDVVGARASNAGDDFHILWALRHALRVLDPASSLSAVTVEGIPSKDTADAEKGAWEGVDVALFFGGESLTSATRIEIEQLKYSTTSPTKAWTIARLCYSSRQRGNNSVISRLAKAYAEALRLAPQLSSKSIVVRLVSNQPVHREIIKVLEAYLSASPAKASKKLDEDWTRLEKASGLDRTSFVQFARALDFSECQGPSRFEVQERVIEAIARVAASETRQAMFELRNVVYSRMLPGDSSAITRAVILGAMFVGDPLALLPCPPQLKQVARVVSREAVTEILREQSAHQQRFCLHGEGGCGKTTALQELATRLPSGSEMIVFDCYGGGRYLDSDGQRHLPRHAFLQLSNELSARVGVPMLIAASSSVDYIREFSLRLQQAADIVGAKSEDALLVIAVDAADNSVTAAQTRVPSERSFVFDVATLGSLPSNVRLIISARTGRLPSLQLPESFTKVAINDFTQREITEFVHMHWDKAPSAWIDDMHFLSGGNPRVISYAFEYAAGCPENALTYLKPSGKDLQLIFGARVKEALRRSGNTFEFERFCAALVVLARPIPIVHLAAILGISEALVCDLCNDLMPGIREDDGLLGFSDEDFEAFIWKHAEPLQSDLRNNAAEYLLSKHQSDAYCAEHVAAALFDAGRASTLLTLAQDHPEPKAVKDPVRRREVQLHRLKLAMRVARTSGQRSQAILVLLRGAHALKTDAAVRKMLTDNVDLAAHFAQKSLRRTVLLDKQYVALQGRVLARLMLDSALKNDAVRARDWGRQFSAWLRNYFERRDNDTGTRQWKFDFSDIAAEGEAILRLSGAQKGIDALRRWIPKELMAQVVQSITHRLLVTGDYAVVESVLKELSNKPHWDVLIRVPLAISGQASDVATLQRNIGRWVRCGWLNPEAAHQDLTQHGHSNRVVKTLLTAAEVVAARIGVVPEVKRVLDVFATQGWRRRDKLYPSAYDLIDASLRAHVLLERVAGRIATVESFLLAEDPPSPEPVSGKKKHRRNSRDESVERIKKFIRELLPIYNARAACLLPSSDRLSALEDLRVAIGSYGNGNYGVRDSYDAQSMRDCMGESIATMLHVPELRPEALAELACNIAKTQSGSLSARELALLGSCSLHENLHEFVLNKAIEQAKSIAVERAPATERAERLIDLARLIVGLSPSDAESLFASATAVLADVDIESVFQLEMLEPFSKAAATVLKQPQRRTVACHLADLSRQIWSCLGDEDRLPWEAVINSVTYLDPTVSFAAMSSWDDAGVIRAGRLIPDILSTGQKTGELPCTLAVPLIYLGTDIDSNVLDPIAADINSGNIGDDKHTVVEELAKLTLLNMDGHNGSSELRAVLDLAFPNKDSRWVVRSKSVLQFFDQHSQHAIEDRHADATKGFDESDTQATSLSALSKGKKRFVAKSEIEEAVAQIINEGRERKKYIGVSSIFDEMRRLIRPMDRRSHLDALADCNWERHRHEQASAIATAVLEWRSSSPSVASWCEDKLPALLARHLPSFYQSPHSWETPLPQLLNGCGLSSDQICEALLEGLELHANKWDAQSVYSLLAAIAPYVAPAEAAEVLTAHLEAEARRITSEVVRLDARDIPDSLEIAAGRALYAFLGDADLRVRWAAAHGVRTAARLGQQSLVDAVFDQWDRLQERSFRDSRAPFYWLAARLWLMIVADRVASESPELLKTHGRFLFNVAVDEAFPHVLCRHFAKEAAIKLLRRGLLSLDSNEKILLERANSSSLTPAPSAPGRRKEFDRHFGIQEDSKRRFKFDSMDTLPYWYSQPLRVFADVSGDEFLTVAEEWIVDKWRADTSTWMWANEPRKIRFEREALATSHSHGSLPTIERAHTHFEWHAMWCTVGTLLQTRPLALNQDETAREWKYWKSHMGLTQPPLWLSDLRTSKPLVHRYWFSDSRETTEWLNNADVTELLSELGLDESAEEVIVESYVSISEGERRSTINVSSALVASETASSLLRALQTVGDPWQYRIPVEGDELEIDAHPYRLLGWLGNSDGDSRLDQGDLLRREVSACSDRPGKDVIKVLELRKDLTDPIRWVGEDSSTYFCYVAWSDDMSDGASRYSSGFPRSYGHRLLASKPAIQQYLKAKNLDLIIEVQLTKVVKDSDSDDNSEEPKETQFDLVLVFRRDGSIEDASGCIGSWAIPCSGAGTGGGRGHARALDDASPSRTNV